MRGDQFIGLQPSAVGDLVRISENRRGWYAIDGYALTPQPAVAPLVVRALVVLAVNRAIDFDGQPRRRTIEVEDVRSERVLISESGRVRQTTLEARPKHKLRLGQGPAESLRAL
jgi:hypothetical protein